MFITAPHLAVYLIPLGLIEMRYYIKKTYYCTFETPSLSKFETRLNIKY